MIQVTIFNEHIQEQLDRRSFDFQRDWGEEGIRIMAERAAEIRRAHEGGAIHDTLRKLVEETGDVEVVQIATVEDADNTLTDEVLERTDVLLWWGHMAHEQVSDAVARRVRDHVQRGMGAIFLHSAHLCKPMGLLLGTSCTLRWREDSQEWLWCCNPAHPIAAGVPVCTFLEQEEMYGEFFDVPAPDELVFLGSFQGGEVLRAGCVWNRGYGKVFFFQPGHETYRSYYHPSVRKILQNAVHYLNHRPVRQQMLECLPV